MIDQKAWDDIFSTFEGKGEDRPAISEPVRYIKDTGPETVPSLPSSETVPVPEPFFKTVGSHVGQQSAWNASELIIDYDEEQISEEDLQCYQIRRKYTNVAQNDKMEELLRVKQEIESAWNTGKDLSGSMPDPAMKRYLEIEKELTGSGISDETQQKILLLKNGTGDEDPSIKQFYSAFSLMQGAPSRERIEDVIRGIDELGSKMDEGLHLLRMAIEEALEAQNKRNAQTDRRYQGQQKKYDRQQHQAQDEYNSAKRRTDRWR